MLSGYNLLTLEELSDKNKVDMYELYVACVDGAVGPQWSKDGLNDILALLGVGAFFIENSQNQLIGYIVWRTVGGEAELLNIGVLPEYRNKAFGKSLITAMLSDIKREKINEVFLEVREGNIAAHSLYSALGFSVSGKRDGYYKLLNGGQEHALIMTKAIYSE